MPLELTEAQRRAVADQGCRPVEVIDPATQRTYYLIEREQLEKVRPALDEPPRAEPADLAAQIPPGIRKSQEAFWRVARTPEEAEAARPVGLLPRRRADRDCPQRHRIVPALPQAGAEGERVLRRVY